METKGTIKTLETEVKEFSNDLPYWAKYFCAEILSGNDITDEIVDKSYSYLLEHLGLTGKTEKPDISIAYNPNASEEFKEHLSFDTLENVEGVNALAENQVIELTQNLTIVYGSNGAGKSGYTRLLKNVFYSKDKENILPNINNSSGHKAVSAQFTFTSNGNNIQLMYPKDIGNGIFNQFSVFDGDIGKKHLSGRNEFSFRPAGLQLFNDLNSALERVNTKLNNEVRGTNTANPFEGDDIFQGESEIKSFLSHLSHNSNLEDLRAHLPYTDEEKEEKARLDKEYDDLIIAFSQKDKTLKNLKEIKDLLKDKKNNLEKINSWFSSSQLSRIKIDITDCTTKEKIAQNEGVQKFKSDKIRNIGSPEWKSFIAAAQKFASTQGQSEYPEIGENCLFCQQPINHDAPKTLIRSYWVYIKSLAEKEARSAKEKLVKIIKNYEMLDLNQFQETEVLIAWLREYHEPTLTALKKEQERQETLRQTIILNISKKINSQQSEVQLNLGALDKINETLDDKIREIEEDEQSAILAEIGRRKTFLAHKEKLESRYSDIENLHKNLIWVNKAKKFSKKRYKSQSTSTEKRLSREFFNTNYINSFNNECEDLNGKFGIEIDAKSSDAKSNRRLFLKGKNPSDILSEGEQKVIAIADFIAENNITKINKGLIFDDPVNSLDDERKSVIAERLVTLSENKQVIIFTHDLVFVSSLINFAGDKKLEHDCHWIEKINNKPGHVWLRNSPTHERVYRNAEPAKRIYKEAKKDNCAPEKREFLIRNGFTALRTCYEVLVIHGLFKNVVQRYNERVSIESLSSVDFNDELVTELLDNFYQCCRYMEGHTHSDKYSYKKPEPSDLNNEIQRYEAIRRKINKKK